MKIRIDFVTNSSSSNFTVAVTIWTASGCMRIEEDPSRYDPDGGGEAVFADDLRNINSHLSSVEELATWLANSIKQDTWGHPETVGFKKKKSKFIKDACTKIKSVRDIEKITVERQYDAWGEFAEFLADNDELIGYAQKYIKSEGIEKERAEAEMITYIHTATDVRGEFFGENSINSRYNWYGKSVEQLAQRLCSGHGPNSVSGIERKELNLKTGEYFDVSEFDLE